MKTIHVVTVGKLKDKSYETIEAHYLKQIKNPVLKISEVKTENINNSIDSSNVLKKIAALRKESRAYIILLTENGEKFDSPKFSKWLHEKIYTRSEMIFFVIGGASGHGQELIDKANSKLSLSDMTFPHKLARILLVEQIYRAQTIKDRHPYHK